MKFKGMDEINKIFDELYKSCPEIKEQMDEDEKWRQQRKELLIGNGMSENDALNNSWADYWNMVKKRDGVEFSIHKLSE